MLLVTITKILQPGKNGKNLWENKLNYYFKKAIFRDTFLGVK